MVIKGRFSKKNPKPKQPNLQSPTSQIDKIASLTKKPQCDRALEILHEIAKVTAPIMRQYNFKVGLLCEFFPRDANLLGLNVNGGAKICIRLRPSSNENWFFPMNELIGTMLHELTHNRFGPHDNKFYGLLDELKDKFNDIQVRGSIASTGFVSINNLLGTRNPVSGNLREQRIKKLSEVKYVATVKKLGTSLDKDTVKDNKKKSMRDLILEATERRIKDNKWCRGEIEELENQNHGNDDELTIVKVEDLEDDEEEEEGKEKEEEVVVDETLEKDPARKLPEVEFKEETHSANPKKPVPRKIIEVLTDSEEEVEQERPIKKTKKASGITPALVIEID